MSDHAVMSGERTIDALRGTRTWFPGDFASLAYLERRLLLSFEQAGFERMRTPVLEPVELHERKSGAGIVSKLIEVPGAFGRACLRPELTAGILRAYIDAPEVPALPWRVAQSGPVFRLEDPRPGFDREFSQVGVEVLGGSGTAIDAELIWLADKSLRDCNVDGATIRIGHVGLILEVLRNSGLPEAVNATIVERLSDAASEGREDVVFDEVLSRLAGWAADAEPGAAEAPSIDGADGGVDRLFRTLIPVVSGRRSGREIVDRLLRKWDLGHSLADTLNAVRSRVHDLAGLRGRPSDVLDRLARDHRDLVPKSVDSLRELIRALHAYGIAEDRIEIDLGLGRGIGFYSQMVFSILAPSPSGPIEVCGGGRYDGLARVFGSDRDDRGAGFAFGLERLRRAQHAPAVNMDWSQVSFGWLVAAVSPETDILAAIEARRFLLADCAVHFLVVLDSGRSIEESLAYAARLRLGDILEVRGPDEWIYHAPRGGWSQPGGRESSWSRPVNRESLKSHVRSGNWGPHGDFR